MSKRLSSQKSNRVKWAPDANLCQVKLFLSEDCPAQVGTATEDHLQAKTSWMLHSNGAGVDDDPPPGFEGKGFSGTFTRSSIPQIIWKSPPRFILNSEWYVAAGELSKERETQEDREMRVLEAVYPRVSAIPSSPLVLLESEESDWNDENTPVIPVNPIEEDVREDDDSPPPSIAPVTQYTVPAESKPAVIEKPLRNSTSLQADALAAASLAFEAIMKSKEKGSLIDTDLLIKILSDPEMIEKLSKDFSSSATTMAFPMSKPKPLTENSNSNMQFASNSVPTSQQYQIPTIPLLSNANSDLSSSIQVPKVPLLNTNLSKKLDDLNQLLQTLLSSATSSPPVTSSALKTDEIMSRMPLDEGLGHPKTVSTTSSSHLLEDVNQLLQTALPSATTLPNYESKTGNIIPKKHVDEELGHPRIAPTTSRIATTSESFTQIDRNSIRNPEKPVECSFVSTHIPAMITSTRQTNQSLHPERHPRESSYTQKSVFSLSSMNTPVIVKDANYYKSLIKQHGMEKQEETQEKYIPQYKSRVSELISVSRYGNVKEKIPKSCKYFNSSKGCRKGSSCPYQHDSVLNLRAGSIAETYSSKRIRLS